MTKLKALLALGLLATGIQATPILYLVTQPGGSGLQARTGMELLTLDAATGISTLIGNTVNNSNSVALEMFDIAVNTLGELYGVDAGHDLWLINPANARATLVSGLFNGLGVSTANALAFGSDGLLYVAGNGSQEIRRFDPTNPGGAYTTVAVLPTGVGSGGDVVFHGGLLYVAATDDKIYEFDLTGFTPGTPITAFRASTAGLGLGGDIALKGLASTGGNLYVALDLFAPVQNDFLYTVNIAALTVGSQQDITGVTGYAAGLSDFVGVPEPSALLLSVIGLGLIGLGRSKRRS